VAGQQMQQQCISLLACVAAQFQILVKRHIPIPADLFRRQDYRLCFNPQSFVLGTQHLQPPMARDSTADPNNHNSTSVLFARFGSNVEHSTFIRSCRQSGSGNVRTHVICLRSTSSKPRTREKS
jgi:hypothetical protein